MAYEFDCAWCGKHAFVSKYRGQPPKYCSDQCRRDSAAAKKREHRKRADHSKQNGTSKPKHPGLEHDGILVPVMKCAKCRYSQLVGRFLVCGYFEFTGQTRTSRHPEGLTADCREFKPLARARKKVPIKVNG